MDNRFRISFNGKMILQVLELNQKGNLVYRDASFLDYQRAVQESQEDAEIPTTEEEEINTAPVTGFSTK